MLVYLSKKIAIPNQVRLNCISWNRDQGYIACGGENGLLKVLKLETPSGPDALLQGVAASSNLSMNQTLEGHNGGVMCVTWNPIYRKLTTSDESGLIIVWIMHKGAWYEEMINNRNKSVVKSMKWTSDGRKIAIVYEDGAVIVGSVDGNRLWGKELGLQLRLVEWSPDGKLLLFVTQDAEVFIFDGDGNKLRSLSILNHDSLDCGIVALHWYCPVSPGLYPAMHADRYASIYTLCVAFENGMLQLSRGEDSSTAIVIDSELHRLDFAVWSTTGRYLAVVGVASSGQGKATPKDKGLSNVVKFYSSSGQFLRSLKVPGERVRGVTWEGPGDLRLALAVDSFIYFANVRHPYLYTFFRQTLVYTYPNVFKRETHLLFWHTTSGEVQVKSLPNVLLLASRGDICAVVVREMRPTAALLTAKGGSKEDKDDASSSANNNGGQSPQPSKGLAAGSGLQEVYAVQLRNSIGVVLQTRDLPFAPKYLSMADSYLALANDRTVFIWQYGYGQVSSSSAGGQEEEEEEDQDEANDRMPGAAPSKESKSKRSTFINRCKIFDLSTVSSIPSVSVEAFRVSVEEVEDPVTALYLCDKHLLLGLRSGTIYRCTLPHLALEAVYNLAGEGVVGGGGGGREIFILRGNCLNDKVALVDNVGVCSVLDLDAKNGPPPATTSPEEGKYDSKTDAPQDNNNNNNNNSIRLGPLGRRLPIDRKDVWEVCWSEDDPNMLAVFEKTKVTLYHITEDSNAPSVSNEEPVLCSAYPLVFRDLEVLTLAADELFQNVQQFVNTNKQPFIPTHNNSNYPSAMAGGGNGNGGAVSSGAPLPASPTGAASSSSTSQQNALFSNPSYLVRLESRLLREMAEKGAAEGPEAAYQFALSHPHRQLFALLGRQAVEEGHYDVARRCWVQTGDYRGLQLLRKLSQMTDKLKMKAEVYYYLQRNDLAESLYREIDRKDLIIKLYEKVRQYGKVVQLLQTGGGNDRLLQEAYQALGRECYEQSLYRKALPYLALCRDYPLLLDCHYRLQHYPALRTLAKELPDDPTLFYTLAVRFESVGMCDEAVECYLKCHSITSSVEASASTSSFIPGLGQVSVSTLNMVKLAIDCAVRYNQWNLALQLAERYHYPQIEGVLNKTAYDLIVSNRLLTCMELFRLANKPTEAALVIHHFALTLASQQLHLPLAKKLYVLSAMEIERHRQKTLSNPSATSAGTITATSLGLETDLDAVKGEGGAGGLGGNVNIAEQTAQTVQTLMMTNLLEGAGGPGGQQQGTNATLQMTMTTLQTLTTQQGGGGNSMNKKLSKAFANAWRGAAAYHFYMLSMRQYYCGAMDAAMKTAIKLCEYDDLLPARAIYSLLCLAALKNRFYATCSKALVKLETLPNLSETDREALQTLAIQIFTRHPPQDDAPLLEVYSQALDLGKAFNACTLTGRALGDSPIYTCRTCRHSILEYELENYCKHAYKYHLSPTEKNPVAPLAHCPLCHSAILTSSLPSNNNTNNNNNNAGNGASSKK
eukprot:gene6054-6668_t